MVSPIRFQIVNNQRLWNPVSGIQAKIREVKKQWSELTPYELAGKINDLGGRVQQLSPNTPGLKKVQKLVGGLQFQFIFPVSIEVKAFCRKIQKLADRMFKTQSLHMLHALNQTQLREIERYRGKA